ncbi:hypothetical protein BMW24_018990 [Mycobacterium heckeshornense]|nr:hypothetical protein ACT16_13895 [Mycobacterium heckeshornense]PIJ32257.1 hypothetical protein BMW24_018990 [Mycobacterium heckeshornense]
MIAKTKSDEIAQGGGDFGPDPLIESEQLRRALADVPSEPLGLRLPNGLFLDSLDRPRVFDHVVVVDIESCVPGVLHCRTQPALCGR